MLAILHRNSANIKSVCSCITIKDSQPNNIYVRDDSKPIHKFYITGVPHIMENTM